LLQTFPVLLVNHLNRRDISSQVISLLGHLMQLLTQMFHLRLLTIHSLFMLRQLSVCCVVICLKPIKRTAQLRVCFLKLHDLLPVPICQLTHYHFMFSGRFLKGVVDFRLECLQICSVL